MFGCSDKGGERRRGGPQLVVQQPSAHSSPTCSTLILDDSCIWGYFCRKSFLILQVGADFFFCQDGSQVWVKEKIGEMRVGAFDMEPSRLFFKKKKNSLDVLTLFSGHEMA